MKRHNYYPEHYNPNNFPSAEPYIDVRCISDEIGKAFEVVETSGPVYTNDKDRFYFKVHLFFSKTEALEYATELAENHYQIIETKLDPAGERWIPVC